MEVFVPPPAPVVPSLPVAGFTLTVTTTAATILTTALACYGVALQSSGFNDSAAAMTGTVYVQVDNGSGTAVKAWELVQGETIFIPCSTTSELKVVPQAGTGWVRGFVYRATAQ